MPREKQRPDGHDLPELKAITEIRVGGESVRVHEGLGEKGDIVALGCMPLEAKKGRVGMIIPYEDRWFFSLGSERDHLHVIGAGQTWTYMLKKKGGDIGMDPYYDMYEEGVRFDVDARGPATVFHLDSSEEADKLDAAKGVLKQLGVPDDRIKVTPFVSDKERIRP